MTRARPTARPRDERLDARDRGGERAASRRDLPLPCSPRIATAPPRPAASRPAAARRRASSASRPTNGALRRRRRRGPARARRALRQHLEDRHAARLALERERRERLAVEALAGLVARRPRTRRCAPTGAFDFSRAATFTVSPSTWNSRTTRPRTSPATSGPLSIPTCRPSGSESARAAVIVADVLAHLERGGDRGARRVRERQRVAEHHHQAVAEIFVDGAAVATRDRVEAAQAAGHDQVGALGAERGREPGEPHQAREHHRGAHAARRARECLAHRGLRQTASQ